MSYLTNRHQFIEIEEKLWKKLVDFEVPQDSILGAILFNLYEAELPIARQNRFNMLMTQHYTSHIQRSKYPITY